MHVHMCVLVLVRVLCVLVLVRVRVGVYVFVRIPVTLIFDQLNGGSGWEEALECCVFSFHKWTVRNGE